MYVCVGMCVCMYIWTSIVQFYLIVSLNMGSIIMAVKRLHVTECMSDY